MQFQITDTSGSIRFLPVFPLGFRHGVFLLIWRNTVCTIYVSHHDSHDSPGKTDCEVGLIRADITLKPYSKELIYIITQMLKAFYLIYRKWINEVSVEFTNEIVFADHKSKRHYKI